MSYVQKIRTALPPNTLFSGVLFVFRRADLDRGAWFALPDLPYYRLYLSHVRYDARFFKRHAFCVFPRHIVQSAYSAHFPLFWFLFADDAAALISVMRGGRYHSVLERIWYRMDGKRLTASQDLRT